MEDSDEYYVANSDALNNYASSYRNNQYADIWFVLDGNTLITETTNNLTNNQKELTNGCGLNYNEYVTLRKRMLKSIYINGGF